MKSLEFTDYFDLPRPFAQLGALAQLPAPCSVLVKTIGESRSISIGAARREDRDLRISVISCDTICFRISEQCSCLKGHSPSLLLRTDIDGDQICLACLCSLISDTSGLLVDRGYAVDEFKMALKDSHFSSTLVTYHDKLLVGPLSDAIGSSIDAVFGKSVMDSILTLCEVAENHGKSLIQDFMLQIARQISAPSQWNRTQSHTLHLMGLLLELYSKESLVLPDAIKTQRGFVPNLISFLGDPRAEFQGEVLFVLYKVASLQDGAETLVRCCPKTCEDVIHALLRCDSDELKINSLALLTILVERALLKIGFFSDHEDESRHLSVIRGSRTSQTSSNSLSRTFIQAVKGCFLSSDAQVQASALGLISLVYSDKTRLHEELQLLVEEGVVNYVLEILRISEGQETVQSLAVDVLTLLSSERQLYMHRCPLVLQTLIPILEKSVGSLSFKLQKDIIDLIFMCILEQPAAVLSTAHSERLLTVLSGLFEQYKVLMDESVPDGGTSRLQLTFFSACSALIALIDEPSCSLTCPAFEILRKTAGFAAEFAAADVQKNRDLSCLKASFCLVKAAYECNERHTTKRQASRNDWPLENQEELLEICEECLSPVLAANAAKVDDEGLVSTAYRTFNLILKTSQPGRACQFSERLALYKFFTLSYDFLTRFSSFSLKEEIYQFMASLIERLVGASFEAKVVNAFPHLPSDPTSLLLLLERNCRGEENLVAAQHAAVSILSTSFLYDDRVSSEIEVIASLEQHLLLNKDSTLAETVASDETLKHFLSLYVRGKTVLADRNIASSSEAEKILEALLLQSKGRSLLCSQTPKEIFRWFLKKDSLMNFTMLQLMTWFTSDDFVDAQGQTQDMGSLSTHRGGGRGHEQLHTLAELLVEDPCLTDVPLSLFHWLLNQGISDGNGVALRFILRLARMVPGIGLQLLYANFEEDLLPLLQLHMVEVTESRRLCSELLFQMLLELQNIPGVIVRRSWLDVANQCLPLILDTAKVALDEEALPYMSLVNMILFKSSEEGGPVGAANLLACNKDLCSIMEHQIAAASSQGEMLSRTSFSSKEGRILCGAMIFHLLRLRWALKNKCSLPDHATSYFGFQASDWPTTDHRCDTYATSVTCKELCRILYYGPTAFKILASVCIAEVFSQLNISNCLDSLDTVKLLELPNQFLVSLTMCLQGCVLEDSEVVSRYSSSSLFLLMHSPVLSPQQRRTTASSAWNRMFVEHLLASLSSMQSAGATCTCGKLPCYAAYITLGILRISPPLEWLPSVFSSKIISDLVASLSEDKISPVIICIFQELLRLNYLTKDHLIKLRNIFQAIRKSVYDERRVSNIAEGYGTPKNRNVSSILESMPHFETEDMLQSALLELIVHSGPKSIGNVCPEFDLVGISDTNGVAYFSLTDKFFKDSGLFSD
ncbi:hypothetical protein R1flu_012874 [Riccia fluitans]|uniref:Uncharacterized protein n=1 Tax=Riccia fluitans TaxID=41844 RepID=A0ABD1ZFX9_9MARC